MFLLISNLAKKSITESQARSNFDSACMLFIICTVSCCNFALVLSEKALVFSQSNVHNFFVYIIINNNRN